MPNLNSHMEWSGMDQAGLEYGLAHGDSVEEIAAFLCRDVAEIEAKIAELRVKERKIDVERSDAGSAERNRVNRLR